MIECLCCMYNYTEGHTNVVVGLALVVMLPLAIQRWVTLANCGTSTEISWPVHVKEIFNRVMEELYTQAKLN